MSLLIQQIEAQPIRTDRIEQLSGKAQDRVAFGRNREADPHWPVYRNRTA